MLPVTLLPPIFTDAPERPTIQDDPDLLRLIVRPLKIRMPF